MTCLGYQRLYTSWVYWSDLLYLHRDSRNFIGWWRTIKTNYWLQFIQYQLNVTCPYNDQVNIQYWPGQYWIITRSDVYWPGHYFILTWSILNIDPVRSVYWSHIFRYNKTIDKFPFGQHGKMKILGPGTLGGLTWPRHTAVFLGQVRPPRVPSLGSFIYHVDLKESY